MWKAEPRLTPAMPSTYTRYTAPEASPTLSAKYGAPGKTDREGFDPYADSVGVAGISMEEAPVRIYKYNNQSRVLIGLAQALDELLAAARLR